MFYRKTRADGKKGGAELTLHSRSKHGLCRIRQPLSAIVSLVCPLSQY